MFLVELSLVEKTKYSGTLPLGIRNLSASKLRGLIHTHTLILFLLAGLSFNQEDFVTHCPFPVRKASQARSQTTSTCVKPSPRPGPLPALLWHRRHGDAAHRAGGHGRGLPEARCGQGDAVPTAAAASGAPEASPRKRRRRKMKDEQPSPAALPSAGCGVCGTALAPLREEKEAALLQAAVRGFGYEQRRRNNSPVPHLDIF